MGLIDTLAKRWEGVDRPCLISGNRALHFSDIVNQQDVDLSEVREGDVVALIGDCDAITIASFLQLIDRKAIIVPLLKETRRDHPDFFETAQVNVVVEDGAVHRLKNICPGHPLLDELRAKNHAGLVLFSSGTTGKPHATVHSMPNFMRKFETPHTAFATLNFMLFDHIGGINTMLHTLFNQGLVVAPADRNVASILAAIEKHQVELLPTTPTFLRMLLMSDALSAIPPCLKIISYGAEIMDQPTLNELCRLLPNIDFRQIYGMSEMGIMRVKSEARDSLFMSIGGDGIETCVVDNVLQIRSPHRMLGYLNAPSPFDEEGWYNTKDIVEQKGELIKITGRVGDVINVGGIKFMPSAIERVALQFTGVAHAKAFGRPNPITGQHVELLVEPVGAFDKESFKKFLQERLTAPMMPKRITIGTVPVGHRFKKA